MNERLGILKSDERDLLRETEPARMELLDEDDLIALHTRVRRARKKYQKNYRRQGAEGVQEHGGRGVSRPKNTRAAQKAEIFEDALADVSDRLAVLARAAAEELKQERLAAAQAARSAGPDSVGRSAESSGAGVAREHRQTTGGAKRNASSQAAGARRQAARDGR
ncbi:hypothetical protein [Cellulomonas composti]|uniref:Uncharacterized protein n=1 Tax=Cellulomonas composti TaxID=266130 RepID=A0A511J7U7_9CELL|nr:hypothetical protein [Cellulomonas composti]GEL94044.1 hypothetical protein CCO02nite_07020 [Cellulomonas composti]